LRSHERSRGLAMVKRLAHRGPDDMGLYVDPWASLGHARLSIIDQVAGHQPMSNEDGRIQVVFNGEIYNHRQLHDELIGRGHRLTTRCDTEVIAHLYEDFGESFVHKLNGMFAIALWDASRKQLILVRDRMGVKPLYWHFIGDRVAFGSELKSVLAASDVATDIDPLALKDYLTFGHVPAPRTIFRNVQKLEPGYMAIFGETYSRCRPYWDIPFCAEYDHNADNYNDSAAWTAAFAELLNEAVAMRLESDVPLGAFLSGGIDSAAVVAAMCRNAMYRNTSTPILTHTVGFDETDHDERQQARRVAEFLKTDHREVMVRHDAAKIASRLIRHFDEPFADSCAVPMFHLSQAARQRVTVALSGDGPDEILAGYRRYRFDLAEASTRNLLPAWLRRATFGIAGRMYPKADWLPRPLRAKRTLQNLAIMHDADAHLRSVSLAAGELPDLLLTSDLRDELVDYDPFTRGRDLFNHCGSRHLLNRLLYVDMKTLMVDDILTKVDRASMAVGLEVRTPMLDYRLVELSTRLPTSLKFSGGQHGKQILRNVVQQWLGPTFAKTPKKGFDVPTNQWFREPLREALCDTLLSKHARCRDWIDATAINGLIRNHMSGKSQHGPTLWMLFMLEQWAQAYATPNNAHVDDEQSTHEALHKEPSSKRELALTGV
ncbi:MAG: asparagine synthase (glutamine-hydrolyzing), partial [Phycisphaerae bacterium]|nr:asparagine synthase (glutamine-hydrolyzing) [Phycisphaerae bacterium]